MEVPRPDIPMRRVVPFSNYSEARFGAAIAPSSPIRMAATSPVSTIQNAAT
jgi:hypothetical protein